MAGATQILWTPFNHAPFQTILLASMFAWSTPGSLFRVFACGLAVGIAPFHDSKKQAG